MFCCGFLLKGKVAVVGGGGCERSAPFCVDVRSARAHSETEPYYSIVAPKYKNSPCASDLINSMYNTPIFFVRFSVTFSLFTPHS